MVVDGSRMCRSLRLCVFLVSASLRRDLISKALQGYGRHFED